jgi:hypothetical protein
MAVNGYKDGIAVNRNNGPRPDRPEGSGAMIFRTLYLSALAVAVLLSTGCGKESNTAPSGKEAGGTKSPESTKAGPSGKDKKDTSKPPINPQ